MNEATTQLVPALAPLPKSSPGGFCFIYLRISKDKEGKELGVKRQEQDCRALAASLGLIVVRVFCDNDKSASTNHDVYRAEYEEMMRLLGTGPIKIVLAYTRKRLTRKPSENEQQIRLGRFSGVQYKYVRGEALDLTVSANRKMDRIQAVLDAGEPEDLQELILRKKLEDARHGLAPGGGRAYGYGPVVGVNPLNSKKLRDPYQTIPEEVAVLLEGKRRILAGDSQQLIISDWNRRGVKTARAGEVIKHKGVEHVCDGLWETGKFKQVLLKECYVQFDPTGHPTDCPCLLNPETGGTRVHHNERHRAKWPYIFTRAEHEAMKAVFNGRDIFWSNVGKLKGRTYLLTGITYCGGTWRDTEKIGQPCGGLMYGQGKVYGTKAGRIYQRRYACKKWDNHGFRVGCCSVFRIADAVEHFVTEQVLCRFDSPEVAQALTPADNEDRMAAVIQELAELQTRRELLASEYAAGEHDKEDYQVMLGAVKQKIAAADAEKKKLLSAKAKSLAVPTDGGLREVWKTASLEWRASVVRLVVEKVIIHPGRPGGSRWPDADGWNFRPESVEIVWLH